MRYSVLDIYELRGWVNFETVCATHLYCESLFFNSKASIEMK